MIYSASRRTDLVAFYPDFIAEKIGRSRKLEAVVFWTKDPRNLSEHAGLRSVIARYPCVVQLTVTGLAGSAWEPHVPSAETFAPALRDLADQLPMEAVQWRFDPVMVLDMDRSGADKSASAEERFPALFERFDRVHGLLAAALDGLEEVTISFPDPYRKVLDRLRGAGMRLPRTSPEEESSIVAALVKRSGLQVRACCEPHLLDLVGVSQARCVDAGRFDRLYGTRFADLPKDRGQRATCGCSLSTDIGSYDQVCRHGCRYCYARPAED